MDLSNTALDNIEEFSNAAADLNDGQLALDTNRGGTGNTALLYRDQGGTATNYVDFDGTL